MLSSPALCMLATRRPKLRISSRQGACRQPGSRRPRRSQRHRPAAARGHAGRWAAKTRITLGKRTKAAIAFVSLLQYTAERGRKPFAPLSAAFQPDPGSDAMAAMLSAVTLAQSQAELAGKLAQGISDRGESYFNCAAAPSVKEACPTVPAYLDKESLDLDVPPGAQWIFEGPSWMREIYLVFVVANGGCPGGGGGGAANRKELYGHTPSAAALMPRGERESSSAPCVLSNGAVLAYADGQFEPSWIRKQPWTHGFYMQPHNEEYWQEHERAAQENRGPMYDAFADADGRDMCVPLEYGRVAWPKEGAFDEYLACRNKSSFGRTSRTSCASTTHRSPRWCRGPS